MYSLEDMSEKVVNCCKMLYTKYFYTVYSTCSMGVLYDIDPLEFQICLCNTAQTLELDYFKDVHSSGHQSEHGPLKVCDQITFGFSHQRF